MINAWKTIDNYKNYAISTYGECRNIITGKLLKPHHIGKGYYTYRLYNDNSNRPKEYKIHRLVAEAFIPNPLNLPHINHKDENPSNNCVDNLEWCDAKYNANYGTRNKRMRDNLINKHGVKVYIKELNLHFDCVRDCAKYLGIDPANIFHQLNGKQKTCKGYKIEKEVKIC